IHQQVSAPKRSRKYSGASLESRTQQFNDPRDWYRYNGPQDQYLEKDSQVFENSRKGPRYRERSLSGRSTGPILPAPSHTYESSHRTRNHSRRSTGISISGQPVEIYRNSPSPPPLSPQHHFRRRTGSSASAPIDADPFTSPPAAKHHPHRRTEDISARAPLIDADPYSTPLPTARRSSRRRTGDAALSIPPPPPLPSDAYHNSSPPSISSRYSYRSTASTSGPISGAQPQHAPSLTPPPGPAALVPPSETGPVQPQALRDLRTPEVAHITKQNTLYNSNPQATVTGSSTAPIPIPRPNSHNHSHIHNRGGSGPDSGYTGSIPRSPPYTSNSAASSYRSVRSQFPPAPTALPEDYDHDYDHDYKYDYRYDDGKEPTVRPPPPPTSLPRSASANSMTSYISAYSSRSRNSRNSTGGQSYQSTRSRHSYSGGGGEEKWHERRNGSGSGSGSGSDDTPSYYRTTASGKSRGRGGSGSGSSSGSKSATKSPDHHASMGDTLSMLVGGVQKLFPARRS
ncbi:hypothetical protein LTS18_006008, partial [Coniosporium uncinatum]